MSQIPKDAFIVKLMDTAKDFAARHKNVPTVVRKIMKTKTTKMIHIVQIAMATILHILDHVPNGKWKRKSYKSNMRKTFHFIKQENELNHLSVTRLRIHMHLLPNYILGVIPLHIQVISDLKKSGCHIQWKTV